MSITTTRVWVGSLMVLNLAWVARAAQTPAEDPSGIQGIYARKATWQETMYAAREAMIAREAAWIAAGKGEADLVPGVSFGNWWRIGPFLAPGEPALDAALPPETDFDLAKDVGDQKWQEDPSLKDGLLIQVAMKDKTRPQNPIMYFSRTITAAEPTQIVVTFRWGGGLATSPWDRGKIVGANGGLWRGMTAWLDGATVFQRDRATHFTSHDQNVRLDLRRGENRLLVKVLGGGGGFGFGFRCLGRAELLEGIKDLPDKDPGPPPLVGVNDKIDWKRSLRPPAEHFLNPLWKRLAGDFTTVAVRRQMDWERRDGIGDCAWAKGSVREMAMRYAARCDGDLKTAAQKLAEAAKTHADLEAVRQLYCTSKRIAHAPDDDAHESLRLAIEDLLRTFGDRYPKGQQFLDRAESLRQTMVKAMPDAQRGDAVARAAFNRACDDYADLRCEALLANPLLVFDKLLVVKRFTGYSIPDYHNGNEPGQPANFQQNCSMATHGYNNEIAVLSPVHPDGKLTTLYRPKDTAFVGDVDLHWDADRAIARIWVICYD